MTLILNNSMLSFTQDSNVKGITETLRTTAIANRDDSTRVKQGQFKIMKSDFEKDFKKSFEKSKLVKSKTLSYTFDYLPDSSDGIKAIRVKVVGDGQEYQATCVVNFAES
ncbi:MULTISPECIES: hypothetical protein [Vagococcus]|uniref:Phage protein n=1 Tax=Vagococcus fluvialis bH819 TaxID=1255619 RepID=A0A1X6WRV7_9ENTE|nr:MULTISPECIES: hypothetical protein [Vagococcus]SLM87091.1 hypothetical protein FM121_13415 [Vagococcus fluvialis bH819]